MAVAMFSVLAVLALAGGIGVVASRQPINSVLSLVVTMVSLSGLFLMLSAQFVFAVQVIVYAGAVMVLFLFVVTLLVTILERRGGPLRLPWVFSLLIAAPFFGVICAMLCGVRFRAPRPAVIATFVS